MTNLLFYRSSARLFIMYTTFQALKNFLNGLLEMRSPLLRPLRTTKNEMFDRSNLDFGFKSPHGFRQSKEAKVPSLLEV